MLEKVLKRGTCCRIFDHIVNPKIVNWINLVAVWLNPSTHV